MTVDRQVRSSQESVHVAAAGLVAGHDDVVVASGSGARLMTTLVHHMRGGGIRDGLRTMCERGGQADATILELL